MDLSKLSGMDLKIFGVTDSHWIKRNLIWEKVDNAINPMLGSYRIFFQEGPGAWWTLHSEIIKNGSEIQGTRTPTSHEILLDVYFVLPFGELKMGGVGKHL